MTPTDAAVDPDAASGVDRSAADHVLPDGAGPDAARADAAAPDQPPADTWSHDGLGNDSSAPDAALPDVVAEDIYDPCQGITCGANAHCEQGSCACDSGYDAHPENGCPPFSVPDFTFSDRNPDSATFDQARTLSAELGKVIVIYYVLYT